MSRWKDKLNEHPIHETLSELETLINTDFDDIDEQELVERRRFDKVLNAYKRCIANLDAEIVPLNQIDR